MPMLPALLLMGLSVGAAEPVDYGRDVKPVLAAHCFVCHGALKQEASLRLDTVAAMRTGGDNGPAIMPGEPDKSRLIARIEHADPAERMPPEDAGAALPAERRALLRRWIEQGASGPADEKPEPDPRDHWAFRAPVRPPVPQVKNAAWVGNPIDAFIAAEHERAA